MILGLYTQSLKLRSEVRKRAMEDAKLTVETSQPKLELSHDKSLESINRLQKELVEKQKMTLELKRKSEQYSKIVK